VGWTPSRPLAVETARKLARACGASFRDEGTTGEPEVHTAAELAVQRPAYLYQGAFRFGEIPDNLSRRVTIEDDLVTFEWNPLPNPNLGQGCMIALVAGILGGYLHWGFYLVCAAAVLYVWKQPERKPRAVLSREALTLEGHGIEPLTVPWNEISNFACCHGAVEATIDDRPVRVLNALSGKDADWAQSIFETISGVDVESHTSDS
jgi:hypothetical protein